MPRLQISAESEYDPELEITSGAAYPKVPQLVLVRISLDSFFAKPKSISFMWPN